MAAPINTLVIPDLHCPYHHPDAFDFLDCVRHRYDCESVRCVGDEVDHHAISFHDSHPDLDGAGVEYEKALACLHELHGLFPQMVLVESNHGSLHLRRGIGAGLPSRMLKNYNEMWDIPKKDWQWHEWYKEKLSCGMTVVYQHALTCSHAAMQKELNGISIVQGHHHNTAGVVWKSTPEWLLFGMTVGCLVDPDSKAMAYARRNDGVRRRQILGCGVILDGMAQWVPMFLNKKGRWSGRLP